MAQQPKKQIKILGLSTGGIAIMCGLCLCAAIANAILRPSSSTAPQPTAPVLPTLTEAIESASNPPTKPTIGPTDGTNPTDTAEPPTTEVEGEFGQVTRIIDGDTIDVDLGGQVQRIRYIGIDTPEKGHGCFEGATQANVGLVYQQTVRLVKDVSETDQFNRLLRYVYVGNSFINAILVKQGWALAEEYPPDTQQASYLESLELEARTAGRGCYTLGGFDTVAIQPPATTAPTNALAATQAPIIPTNTPEPVVQPTQPPPPANVGYACPGGQACIKGNINSEGVHIYHYPGCPNYDDTIIDESKGERWFTTGAEAEAAGWRVARNC